MQLTTTAPWLGARAETKVGTESHAVYVARTTAGLQLIINPNPRILEDYIAGLRVQLGPAGRTPPIVEALTAVEGYVRAIARLFAKRALAKAEPSFTKATGSSLRALLRYIAQELNKLPQDLRVGGQPVVRPASVIDYDQTRSFDGFDVGTGATAWLSTNPGAHFGSPPAEGTSRLWAAIKERHPSLFVRGHIINKHVYGTGEDERNLTPLSDHYNQYVMSPAVEEIVKKMVLLDNRVVRYRVAVEYNGHRPQDGYTANERAAIPTALVFTVKELVPDGSADIKALPEAQPQPPVSAQIDDLRLEHPLPPASAARYRKNTKRRKLLDAASGQRKLTFAVPAAAHAPQVNAPGPAAPGPTPVPTPAPGPAPSPAPNLAGGGWARQVTAYFRQGGGAAEDVFPSPETFRKAAAWYIDEELSEVLAATFRESYDDARVAADHEDAVDEAIQRVAEEWGQFYASVTATGAYKDAFVALWKERSVPGGWLDQLVGELVEDASSDQAG